MYRDLWSTKGRKYGQRQSKLNTMRKKGIIPSAALGITHASQCSRCPWASTWSQALCLQQTPLIKCKCLCLPLPGDPRAPARQIRRAQPCAARRDICWQHWFAGRTAEGKMLPSPSWCPVCVSSSVSPLLRVTPHPTLVNCSQWDWLLLFLLTSRKVIPKPLAHLHSTKLIQISIPEATTDNVQRIILSTVRPGVGDVGNIL